MQAATPADSAAFGPFVCTEVIGMMTTGEWYNSGFETTLGAELGNRWQGRFAHYGYVMEYAITAHDWRVKASHLAKFGLKFERPSEIVAVSRAYLDYCLGACATRQQAPS